jgi:hypothetical protein
MVGLALIVPLSLLLMWRRVRRRGGYGRKASAVLRSVFPLVLGLGGWFIGLLTVLLVFPTVALDDELVACLSIGLPIGLGAYLAWVNGGLQARARRSAWPEPWRARSSAPGSGSTRRPGFSPSSPPSRVPWSVRT